MYETVVRGRVGQLLNCETRLARTDVLTALCWSHIQYSVAYHKQMHATEYESCFSLCNNWGLSVMRETTQLSLSLSQSSRGSGGDQRDEGEDGNHGPLQRQSQMRCVLWKVRQTCIYFMMVITFLLHY